tara:strand:- start:214 stop:507 length:294 start_codon:yes stop_codon:yes gene_type:complete
MEEFEHHIRLSVADELGIEDVKFYYDIVKNMAFTDVVEPEEESDTIMVYHIKDDMHHYDISLNRDITPDEGDLIAIELDESANFDFMIEATHEIASQ